MVVSAGSSTFRSTENTFFDQIASDPVRRRAFEAMLAADNRHHLDRYCWSVGHYFADLDLHGKTILEIGSGKGLTTVFMGLQGAGRVVSMEPGLAGSRSGGLSVQETRVAAAGLENVVELLAADFNTWDPQGQRFDVIVSVASINHIHESPHHALRHPETYRRYLEIWRKVRSLLNPGGVFCVGDVCRYGFFLFAKDFGIRRPWTKKQMSMDWRIHQNPGVWRKIALEAGFSTTQVSHPPPFALRGLGPLAANPLANFFLHARFVLRAFA